MTLEIERAVPIPSGWLMNPELKLVLFFIRDNKSLIRLPKVITQLWHATPEGIPTKVKNTKSMDLEVATEVWNELISNGWILVDSQINTDSVY